jgi:hypothetical protein
MTVEASNRDFIESMTTVDYSKKARFNCLVQVYLYPPHDFENDPLSLSNSNSNKYLRIPKSFSNFWAYEPDNEKTRLKESLEKGIYRALKTTFFRISLEEHTEYWSRFPTLFNLCVFNYVWKILTYSINIFY